MRHDRASAIISLENSGAFIAPIKMFIAEHREGGGDSLLQRKRLFTLLSTSIIRIVEIIKFYLCAQQMRAARCAGGALDRKTKAYAGRVTAAAKQRGVISLIRHLSRIFMSLNNPKAARVFAQEIKSHVQRPDGNFLFARCRWNLFCSAPALTFVFIYHRALSARDAITTRKNNAGTRNEIRERSR